MGMPDKKKFASAKSQPGAVAKVPDVRSGDGTAQPAESRKQLANFEAAMRLFHSRQWKEARELFREAGEGPERDVADRAQLHAVMCERRLQQASVSLQSAEELYTYGIALINTRNLAEARVHLEKGLAMAPQADHIHYALALAQALSGDLAGAHEHLKRAIELEPRNRILARQDADFASMASQPLFHLLLYPEKN